MATTRSKRDVQRRDDLARFCARLHYEEQASPAEINETLRKRKMDVRGVRDVRSLIARARDVPLVRISVEDVHKAPVVDLDLGDRLAAKTGVGKVVVLCSSLASDDHWDSPDHELQLMAYKEADALHYQLGQQAAEYLIGTLRDGDAVGIGPGRGTGFTAHNLKRLCASRRIQLPASKVFSLAGKMWAQPWHLRGVSGEYLDADENALEFAAAISIERPRVKLVHLPLFLGDIGEGAAFIKNVAPHLLGDDWHDDLGGEKRQLDVAIFGLGALNAQGTHYAIAHPGPHAAVGQDIQRLRDIVPDCPGAIIDVGDRFWLQERGLDNKVCKSARAIVKTLNQQMTSVSFPKLQSAVQRVVVAGGHQKFDAIRTFLFEGERIGVQPTAFFTDDETARRLLDEPGPPISPDSPNHGVPPEPTSAWLAEVAALASTGARRRLRDDLPL